MNPIKKFYIFMMLTWIPRVKRFMALKKHLPSKGVFFEVGAHDGVTQSNTIGLQRWLGWKGVLVEPVPSRAALCKINRKNAIVETCALVSSDFTEATVELWDCGLMSVVKDSHPNESLHLEQGSSYQNITPTLISTPVKTISQILTENKIEKLDFLSLDLEGYEEMALKGLGKYKPTFMLIEGVSAELQKWLDPLYEKICRIGDDGLFRLKSDHGYGSL